MRVCDLPTVLSIEQALYAMPWSQGNFIDSLAAGYEAFVLRAPQVASLGSAAGSAAAAPLLGYFLAMKGVGEMHLLNISTTARVRCTTATVLLRSGCGAPITRCCKGRVKTRW